VRSVLAALLPCLAWGYSIKYTQAGIPLRWASGTVECTMDPRGTHDLPGQAASGSLRATLATWNAIADSPVRLVVSDGGDPTPTRVEWRPDWEDQPEALALTIVTYEVDTGLILDAEIWFNDEVTWTVAEGGHGEGERYDVQNTLTHEVGHLLGLAHEMDEQEATMYPLSAAWETRKRDLETDDLAGFAYLYDASFEEPVPRPSPVNRAFGCSAAPDRPAHGTTAFALVLIAIAMAGRLRRVARCVALGLVVLCFPVPARATAVRDVSLKDLVVRSDRIVHARVLQSEARWDAGFIWTDTVVEVLECIGGPCGARETIRQRGGEVGGIGQAVEGTVRMASGDSLVLFLRDHGSVSRPVGMSIGVYRLSGARAVPAGATSLLHGGKAAPFDMRELRRLVRVLEKSHQ